MFYILPLIVNLHLNCSLGRICGDMEGGNGLFKGKSMRNKWLKIYQASSDETDGFWILETGRLVSNTAIINMKTHIIETDLIGISILETNIDLIGAQVHERELLFIFPNADDKYFRAKLN